MRLIDADELIESMGVSDAVKWGNKDGYQQDRSYSTLMCYEIKDYIDSQPTIDAVSVIRCKDCKWYDTEYHCKLNGYSCGMSPDWFCADGKKEEE